MAQIKIFHKNRFFFIAYRVGETLWWGNTKGGIREDNLFCITRTYERPMKFYLYNIYIGTLNIFVGSSKKLFGKK